MSDQNKPVVLHREELLTCICALEALEAEVQSMVTRGCDIPPQKTRQEWQALAVSARRAHATLSSIEAHAVTLHPYPEQGRH